jgi:IS1 family transposase
MLMRDVCPQGQSPKYQKNGHIHNGKQNDPGKACGRQCVDCFAHDRSSDDGRALLEGLLVERISLCGICRAIGVTRKWLLGFLVPCLEALPDPLHVEPLTCHQDVMLPRLAVEADEMSSCVQKQANTPWLWRAMDAKTRPVMAFHVGDRSRTRTKRLWAKLPRAYRQHATFDTDEDVVYAGVSPAVQPRAVSRLGRKTTHMERCNNTLRQRVSRLARDALSFSKKLAHHVGAIKLFLCHDNLTRAAA